MTEPLVSVVLPIYNVENKLRRCIDSVINQTYTNLEIILVDDGSPDACPQICDEYANKDARIKVIHKANAGLGFARNTGIENATGKYICFFDSDDYVELTTIEEVCSVAEAKNADMVCFGHVEETENGKIIENRIPNTPKDLFVEDEIKNRLIPMTLSHNSKTGEDWNLSLSAWCELFSLETIRKNNFRFVSEREIISEDIYSVLEYYGYCNTVAFIKKPFYHYISNPCSLSKSYRADRYEKLKVLAEKLHELSVKMDMESLLSQHVVTIFIGLTIGAAKQVVVSKEKFGKKYKDIKKIIKDSFMQRQLSDYDFSGEPLVKRCLLWNMKKKYTWLCYFIFWVKSVTEK